MLGIIQGTTIGVIKGDTRSLDYSLWGQFQVTGCRGYVGIYRGIWGSSRFIRKMKLKIKC